jgi:hypothetical protein
MPAGENTGAWQGGGSGMALEQTREDPSENLARISLYLNMLKLSRSGLRSIGAQPDLHADRHRPEIQSGEQIADCRDSAAIDRR